MKKLILRNKRIRNLIALKKSSMIIFCTILLIVYSVDLNATELYQTTGNLNLRSGPGTNYGIFGVIINREKVKVLEKTNSSWFKIEYKGKSGYLYSKYLTPIASESPIVLERPLNDSEIANYKSSIFYIISAIVVIIFIYIILASNKKPSPSSPTYKMRETAEELEPELIDSISEYAKIEETTSSSNSNYKDESIIDVTDESYRLSTTSGLKKYSDGVPFWLHRYVYSYSEINNSTAEQRKFYAIYKNSFLRGEYIDLEGNTNYAFILLFDFLDEYKYHKDIYKLEKQLHSLGQCYPKTKSYGISFLIQKMELIGDNDGVARLISERRYASQGYNNDYPHWGLGNKYKDKLKLDINEVKILNSLIDTDNKFNSIEFCAIELIRLLFYCIRQLEEYYQQNNSRFEHVINEIAHLEITSKYKYKKGSYNYKSIFENFSSTIYQCIYKNCENSLRDHFNVGRKTDLKCYLNSENATILFKEKVQYIIQPFINLILSDKKEIDLDSEIKINNYNRSRYKYELKLLAESFNVAKLSVYKNAIENLELRNQGNPFIENIYFEASKFVAQYDKSLSLTYYIKYLYYDLNSAAFDNKQLTKTIQKNLFKTNEQLHAFEMLVSELIKNKNLEKALQDVSKLYAVKRKKIQIDKTSILEVQHQHSETVELLNEYLKDEFEDENNKIKTQEINSEEVLLEIVKKTVEVHQSIYNIDISFNQIQASALELFVKSNFSVSQIEMETFAKSIGVFKNQLVESINEVPAINSLDDVLIEEEDEYYTINTNYYQKLLSK
jgi:hypothetical protein